MTMLNFTTTEVTKYIIIRFHNSTYNISLNYYRFNKKRVRQTNKSLWKNIYGSRSP